MKYFTRFLLFFIVIASQNSFCQSTVYVQTNQFGRGILKMRGNEMFVVTPEHLLKDYFGPITVYGEGNKRERVELLKSYAGDLAVLHFPETPNLTCKKWKLHENYATIVDNIFEGYIELREQDGSSTKVAVSIAGVDVQYITVRPKDYREKFYQGMSGSSLFVEYQGQKVLLGMLQSIADDETGSVIRADEMDKLLGVFFNPIAKEKQSNVITEAELTKEIQGLKFELLEITKSGDRVSLEFDVTSLNKDQMLKIDYRKVNLFVDDGAKFNPKSIAIGNKLSHIVEYNLVHGIRVPLTFVFNGVSSSSKFVSKFELQFLSQNETGKFDLRDLYLGDDTEKVQDKGSWSKEDLDFKFDLVGLNKIGTNVSFMFTVTSLAEDKMIKFNWRNVFLYDDKGLETRAKTIMVGNKTSHVVEYNLIRGISVPLAVNFEEVSSAAKGASLLKVGFSDAKNSSVFQIRDLVFSKPKPIEAVAAKTNETAQMEEVSSLTNCSEIYFYRKNGMLECPETVYLYNHGEFLAKLEPGVRFKSIVCDNRSFKLSVRTNPNEVALFSSSPEIEMGKKYYFKIACGMGVSTISLQEDKKGLKDLNNNKKFKRRLELIPLNAY